EELREEHGLAAAREADHGHAVDERLPALADDGLELALVAGGAGDALDRLDRAAGVAATPLSRPNGNGRDRLVSLVGPSAGCLLAHLRRRGGRSSSSRRRRE